MNHGSLFSGIGGFDLASEWMGWKNIFHCEWNDFGKRILKYYWPKSISYDDITKTDFTIHRGKIDILTGGFPCQPYSAAGKRLGKEDDRHLWPEMLRAIREIKPTWVVGENVFGLVNWNGGLVFQEVQTDLEAEGYEVQSYILPAVSVNAPHRRDRVWFVAYDSTSDRRKRKRKGPQEENRQPRLPKDGQLERRSERFCSNGNVADTNYKRQSKFKDAGKSKQQGWANGKISLSENWKEFPTKSPVCDGNDGFSSRLDGITFPKWRNESIKGGGNAIVPQVVHQIFRAIEEYEKL